MTTRVFTILFERLRHCSIQNFLFALIPYLPHLLQTTRESCKYCKYSLPIGFYTLSVPSVSKGRLYLDFKLWTAVTCERTPPRSGSVVKMGPPSVSCLRAMRRFNAARWRVAGTCHLATKRSRIHLMARRIGVYRLKRHQAMIIWICFCLKRSKANTCSLFWLS